jgi:large subunit ribosomal protein L19
MANSISYQIPGSDPAKLITLTVGDTIKVHYKLIEKEKIAGKTKREVKVETRERTQIFEGILLSVRGSKENMMITVRKVGALGIGIERIFPLTSPWIRKIEVKKHGDVRRAKLYYLRSRTGKAATKLHEHVASFKPQAKSR